VNSTGTSASVSAPPESENQDGLVCVHINAPGVNWNGVKNFLSATADNGKQAA